jgi:hypothetical protein
LAIRFCGKGKTMKTKALAVQPILGVTENRAQRCLISGHSLSPSDGSAWAANERGTKRILISILILIVFATGCNSTKSGMGTGTGTSMQGTWTVTGNLGTQSGNETYQVSFVPSPCSVMSPVGTFSVQGPVCFIANNNTGQGSISGKGLLSNASNTGEGVLLGVASNPVPANATFNLLFVLGEKNGSFIEFTGSGTVANGTMTGTGSCSPSTPMCQGLSGTFSGTLQ